jgi:hypothetical protein
MGSMWSGVRLVTRDTSGKSVVLEAQLVLRAAMQRESRGAALDLRTLVNT